MWTRPRDAGERLPHGAETAPAQCSSQGGRPVSAPARVTPSVAETTSKVPRGTLYRGREGMWSWVLHRITGVAIFFFLLVHVLDTALIRVSPEAYNAVIGTYKNQIMGLGEVVLVAAIVVPRLQRAADHPRGLLAVGDPPPAPPLVGRAGPVGRHDARLRAAPPHERLRVDGRGALMTTIADPRSPISAPPPQGTQPREVGLDLHARLRRAAGRPHLRPPVRQPDAGRRHPRPRLRLRRGQARQPVLAVVGHPDAVARAHPRRERHAHHRQRLRDAPQDPHGARLGALARRRRSSSCSAPWSCSPSTRATE